MAIRYSGDVEVRVTYHARTRSYSGRVRAPRGFALELKFTGSALGARKPASVTRKPGPRSPDAHDAVARLFLDMARKWARSNLRVDLPLAFDDAGAMVVRRTFQAPCPVRITRRWGHGS